MRAKQKVKRAIAFCICIMMLLNLLPVADMCMDGALGIVSEAEAAVTSMSASEYNSKVNSFLSDSRYKGGATCTNCYNYTNWFTSYMFGRSPRGGDAFSNPSEIRAGDILHFYHSWSTGSSQHWIVVLSRDGNSLYTAEGNVSGGKVRISNSQYWIEGNQLKERGSTITSFDSGWHHANVSRNSYTVSYNANGGTGAPGNQTKTYGTALTLSSTVPTRTGYSFTSWNTKADGSGTSYAKGAKYTSNASVVLYAQWKRTSVDFGTYQYSQPKVNSVYVRISVGGTGLYLTNDLANKDSNKHIPLLVKKEVKDNSGAQVWRLDRLEDGSYKIVNANNGTVLDVLNTKGDNGTSVGVVRWLDNSGQRWYINLENGKYVISPKISEKTYLSINGTSENSKAQLYDSSKRTYFDIEVIKPVGQSTLKVENEGSSTVPVKFTWTKADNASWYCLYIYDGECWNSNVIYKNEYHTGTSCTVQLKPGTYQAHLSPRNYYPWTNSNVVTFTVKADTYTISYNANGGTGAPGNQTKTYGTALTLSSTIPTRTGYTFTGWNTKADGTGTSYAKGAKYTANASVTLYAQWKPNEYTLTINPNGGMIQVESGNTKNPVNLSPKLVYGQANWWKVPVCTRTGYTLNGLYTAASGGTKVYQADGTCVNEGKYFKSKKYVYAGNLTVYAQWSINKYTVSYNANGGTGAPGNQTKTYGTALTLSSTIPTRTGYTFTSWNTKADGTGTSYAKGAKYTANANVTLYAQWKQNVYNPSGVLESVSGGVQSISVRGWVFDRDDLSKALSIHVYIGGPAGSSTATFVGGLTANKYREDVAKTYPGVGDFHGYEGTFPTSKTGTQTVYVYAINVGSGANVLLGTKTVTIKPYTITYNANGGTGAPGNQTKTYGTDLTLSSTVPTRTGYSFTGWNTKADGTGTSYAAGAKYTVNESVTLYAQWKAESTYKLRLEGATVRRGEQVAIPVYVEGTALGSMTIRVIYDSTKLKYIENSYSAFESTVVNDDVKGVLIIAAMNESKGSTGKLFILNFEAVAEKTSETAVHVTVEESIDEKERNVSLAVQDAVIKITNLLLGDVNGDRKITALDARWVLQAAAGKRALKEYAQAADVNGDGKITALDARWILQAAAGKRKLQ